MKQVSEMAVQRVVSTPGVAVGEVFACGAREKNW